MESCIRALAVKQQFEPHPFTAINIGPGFIDTEMRTLIRASSAADFPEVERFIRSKQQGSLMSPADVAAAVLRILALPSLTGGGSYQTSVDGAQ